MLIIIIKYSVHPGFLLMDTAFNLSLFLKVQSLAQRTSSFIKKVYWHKIIKEIRFYSLLILLDTYCDFLLLECQDILEII